MLHFVESELPLSASPTPDNCQGTRLVSRAFFRFCAFITGEHLSGTRPTIGVRRASYLYVHTRTLPKLLAAREAG